MKKIFTLIGAALMAGAAMGADTQTLPTSYLDGTLMLNEGWFGHDAATMNYVNGNGQIFYRAYQGVNSEYCLGNTSQYGQVFGNRVFVMSKQNYSGDGRTGGRFICMNATDLKFIAQSISLPGGPNDSDGRGFCAANEHKGYVGTAAGFYAIDLDTYVIGTTQLAPTESPKQSGDMIRYGNRVFVAQQGLGVVAVDPATDQTTLIDLPQIAGFTVTADGSLYAACSDANGEFVKIDPETLATEVIDIEGSHGIASPWGTWRLAQICADRDRNIIYYVSKGGWTISSVSAYNLDTKEFTETYLSAPTGQQIYGQISTDPSTGYIVVTCTENGYGSHYANNWIYYFDPTTSAYLTDRTITLETYYWFPSMMLFNGFRAPQITQTEWAVTPGKELEVKLSEITTLPIGNKHLIVYSAESSDPAVCTATTDFRGNMVLAGLTKGTATVTVTAEYQGRLSRTAIPVTVDTNVGIGSVETDDAVCDTYDLAGRRVLTGASAADIRRLPAGIYIAGGKKIIVK